MQLKALPPVNTSGLDTTNLNHIADDLLRASALTKLENLKTPEQCFMKMTSNTSATLDLLDLFLDSHYFLYHKAPCP